MIIAIVAEILFSLTGCNRKSDDSHVSTGFIGPAQGLTNTNVNAIAQDGFLKGNSGHHDMGALGAASFEN